MPAIPVTLPSQVSPPQFVLSELAPHAVRGVEVVAVPVLPPDSDDANQPGTTGPSDVVFGPGAEQLLAELDLDAFAFLGLHRATGKAGEICEYQVIDAGRLTNPDLRAVLFVGLGAQEAVDFRKAGAAVARGVKDRNGAATSLVALADDAGLRAFVVGATLGSFGFSWRSAGPQETPVERIVLAGLPRAGGRQPVLDRAVAVANAGWQARRLATVPSNLKNPPWLAEQAVRVAEESGLDVRVWDEHQLAAEGFGGLLTVGRASASPPRLVQLDYRPPGARGKIAHVVLVGKGVTFDSGGLSIKPAEAMTTMKRDMTGGAVVIAVLGALAAVGCPIRVTGLVAAAENAIGGDSFRPGDVIRHFGGRTTEVTNTDAEGRLVLADAMAYAVDRIKPDALVDIATLTGAMKVALGTRTGGYFANNEVLAASLQTAADQSGEALWRMPLAADYEEKLESKVADADNGAGAPGAITAALFLQHFAGDLPWAHLDVASSGDSPQENDEWTAGPTGFGARVLLHWLERREPLAGVRGR